MKQITEAMVRETIKSFTRCVGREVKKDEELPYPPTYFQPTPCKDYHLNRAISKHMLQRHSSYMSWLRFLEVFYCFSGEKIGKALDIGSGWGTTFHFLKRLGFSTRALDMDNPSKIDEDSFTYWDINQEKALPYPNDEFDAIVCLEVVEHIERPIPLLKEIHRILKPGGIFVLTTPNVLLLTSRINFLRTGQHQSFQWSTNSNSKIVPGGGPGGHITPIDYHRFCWIYQHLGLEIEDVKTNVFTYPKGIIKRLLFYPILALQKYSQGPSYSPLLALGGSLILKARKSCQKKLKKS